MLKRFGLIFSSGLLKLALLSLALMGAGWLVFSTPDNIKKAAEESGLYDSAVTDILENAKQEARGSDTQLPLDDPELEQAAKDAFPSELLSRNSESIIDGIYGWLQGKTDEPEFSVDLNDAKQTFASGIGDYAQRRYESLPACTLQQLRGLSPNIEPFEVTCQAPGLSGAMVREKVLAEIQNNQGYLDDTNFTADDLPKDKQGRTATQNLAAAPAVYSLLRVLPWILGLESILLALVVLFWSDTKRRGLRTIGLTILGAGLFLLIGSWLLNWIFQRMNNPSGEALETSLISMIRSLVSAYNSALTKFSAAYIVGGLGILGTLWYLGRTRKSVHPTMANSPSSQMPNTNADSTTEDNKVL